MRILGYSLLVALLLGGCASASGGGGGGGDPAPEPGTLPAPEGNDSVYSLSNLAAAEGALFQDVEVQEGTVYACTGNAGLRVAARAEDWSLSTVADVAFPDAKGCRSLASAPDGAVFASGQSDLGGSFLSTLTAGTGEPTSTVHLPDRSIESIAASETHVYATAGETGLIVFGRNDGELAEVGTLPGGFDQALGVAVWTDSRVVVANGLSGLAIVDVSDPTAPAIEKSFATFGTARRLALQGDYAFVAKAAGGVSVYDLTESKPTSFSTWLDHGSAVDVALGPDSRVYVANLEDLCVLDATDLGDMHLVGSERIPTPSGTPRVVAVSADAGAAYAAEWSAIWTYAYAAGLEAADIHLGKTSIDFGLVDPDVWVGKGIIVKNLGNVDLEISELKVIDAEGAEHPAFSAEFEKGTIDVGQKALLSINFEPTTDDEVEVWAQFATNDPDESLVRIPITANKIDGYQIGAKFDDAGELVFQEYKTGNDVTYKGEYAGKVVVMAWFASW